MWGKGVMPINIRSKNVSLFTRTVQSDRWDFLRIISFGPYNDPLKKAEQLSVTLMHK